MAGQRVGPDIKHFPTKRDGKPGLLRERPQKRDTRQAADQEERFAEHTSDTGRYLEYLQNSQNTAVRKPSNPIGK